MDTVVGKREKSSVLLTLTERVTGLEIIRRFIPKSKSIDDVSEAMIMRVAAFMNGLPRKRFGYQTPLEHMLKLLACGQ